jgi:hypothetical protein
MGGQESCGPCNGPPGGLQLPAEKLLNPAFRTTLCIIQMVASFADWRNLLKCEEKMHVYAVVQLFG